MDSDCRQKQKGHVNDGDHCDVHGLSSVSEHKPTVERSVVARCDGRGPNPDEKSATTHPSIWSLSPSHPPLHNSTQRKQSLTRARNFRQAVMMMVLMMRTSLSKRAASIWVQRMQLHITAWRTFTAKRTYFGYHHHEHGLEIKKCFRTVSCRDNQCLYLLPNFISVFYQIFLLPTAVFYGIQSSTSILPNQISWD